MKKLITALLLAASIFSIAPAEARKTPKQDYAQKAEPNEAQLESHNHYTNKSGQTVHAPAKSKSGMVPSGASAHCRDGTYSFSKHSRGTCSHHGGVE